MEDGFSSNSFSSGVGAIDAEHRVQMGLVVALADAIREGQEKSDRDRLLGKLVAFTKAHFGAEQRLMQGYGYPEHRAHRREHEELIARIEALRQTCDAGDDAVTLRAIGQMEAWLLDHIRSSDDRLGRYLADRAPAEST